MPGTINKKQLIIVWCLTFTGLCGYAQSLKDHVAKGDRFYQKRDYENALKSYLEALQWDANDAETNFKTGVSYLHRENITKAVAHLEKAYQFKPDIDPDIDYHLGMAYQQDHQFSKANKHYAAFKVNHPKLSALANRKILECSLGDSLMRNRANVEIHPLDPELNSGFAEFSPLVTGDGKTLIFTSNRSSDDYKIKSATNFEDVYVAQKQGTQWGPPEKISPNINIKSNESATSLSHDGKTLFLFYEEGEGDIYTSTLEDGAWTKPVALNQFVNNPLCRETSACISADGKKLYFASDRPGGKGGLDIYVSELGSNGQWGRPSNLGSTINTRENEDSPFLHPDGTLYFSSNGHATLGSNDIFKSEWKNQKWSTPENLGYPINSSGYEGFFTLSPDGKTGYYSATRKNEPGNTDMYAASFKSGNSLATKPKGGSVSEEYANPQLNTEYKIVTKLKGMVIDVGTSESLTATLSLVDNKNNRILSKINTDDSGNFELVIPHGGNFGVTTEKQGYLFNSMHFNLPPFVKYQEIDTHILMVKAEVGSKVVLKNIFFDLSKSDLKNESLAELENIRDLLLRNKHLRVQINGHTDNIGHEATNLTLSLKRAQAVVQYLIGQGIEPKRLEAKGYGSERPLVSNDDEEEGRQINRRTEIEIIESPTRD